MTLRWNAAIVDLDGTMVDTLGDFEVALNRTLADLDGMGTLSYQWKAGGVAISIAAYAYGRQAAQEAYDRMLAGAACPRM